MLKSIEQIFAEVNSGQPVAKPTNLRIPSRSDSIRAYVRLEQMLAQQSREVESFEEADDFELDDSEEWVSPYEEVFEPHDDPPPVNPGTAASAAVVGQSPTQTAPPAPAQSESPPQ